MQRYVNIRGFIQKYFKETVDIRKKVYYNMFNLSLIFFVIIQSILQRGVI